MTIGSVVGYTAYTWLLHHAPLGTVSTYAYVNPVVAIILGVLFRDESLTKQILVGAAIVVASVAVVVREEPPAATAARGRRAVADRRARVGRQGRARRGSSRPPPRRDPSLPSPGDDGIAERRARLQRPCDDSATFCERSRPVRDARRAQRPAMSSGRTGTRASSRPVAARRAAATAAVATTVGGSPIPLTP